VTLRCGATGVVTYTHFSDSFGEQYGNATNDPCKSEVLATFNERGGDLHSHPWFNTTEEFNRGNGCYGDTTPKTFEFLMNLNLENENFSALDVVTGYDSAGAHYLLTPTGRVLRADAFYSHSQPLQVYP
jgi:hypothetical protein